MTSNKEIKTMLSNSEFGELSFTYFEDGGIILTQKVKIVDDPHNNYEDCLEDMVELQSGDVDKFIVFVKEMREKNV